MKRLLPLIAVLLTSCVIPMRREVHIGDTYRGRVLESGTDRPVSGATIRYSGVSAFEILSDSNGYFELCSTNLSRLYWMPPAPVDPPPWDFDSSKYKLIISAPGYLQQSFEREKYKLIAMNPDDFTPKARDPEYYLFYLNKDH